MSTLRSAVSRRRGMVLIIVLSVLAVMAILGISLLTLSALERTVTDNHLHQVQARLSARSGVEDAMARLRDGAVLRSAFDQDNEWIYRGNDIDGKDPSKRAEPVAWGQLPSFPKKSANGLNETVDLWRDDLKATVKVGVSGTSAGRHTRSNIYSLEVRDLSSCIYINDGVHLYGANTSSVSQNLRRILNRLGEHSKIGIGQLGNLVVGQRPSTGYASMQDFRNVMKTKGNLKDIQLDRLQRYITTVAWIDKNVVNPAPLSSATVGSYPVKYERGGDGDTYIYRRGPGRDNSNEDRSKDSRLGWMPDFGGITGLGGITAHVYGYDELYPTYVEVTHRAPVNVNTAEEPVLIALLSDLKGFFVLEKRSGHPFGGDTPSSFNYTFGWPMEGSKVGPIPGSNTDQKALQTDSIKEETISHERGWFTFENMGHTYSDHQWKAKIDVKETWDWRFLYGGTSQSTPSSIGYEPVEDHDAIGDLWITPTIQGGDGSGTVTGGVSAKAIAAEIIACRSRSGRYATAPFGGPFKNWAQFYAFCDNLVEVRKDGQAGAGIMRDERFSKDEERRQAAQAMADLLKANFNPNFTPNEINPDHNLHLMIDKTDLVVNSTEFCLLPTGLFSISSVGRVIRDRRDDNGVRKGDKDSGTGAQDIVAQSRIDAVVRAYDVYRETSQRHFYLGDAPPAEDASFTNNGLTVETGPEPDNGPLLYNEHLGQDVKFIRHNADLDGYAGDSTTEGEVMSGWGYEASGYLALPTRGGIPSVKQKGAIKKPEANGSPKSSLDAQTGLKDPTMRASFRLNDTLDYSAAAIGDKVYLVNAATTVLKAPGPNDPIMISEYVYNPATCSGQVITRKAGGAVNKAKIENTSNFGDPGEEGVEADGGIRLSPYDATDGTRYRIVRSFRLPLTSIPGASGAGKTVASPMAAGGTETLPRMLRSAPTDLRVDGYYSERHSGLAYWLFEPWSGPDQNFSTWHGTASFWFKPNFDPAYSGKVRSIASASRYHRKNFYHRNPEPFTLYYMPAFTGGKGDEITTKGNGTWPGETQFTNYVWDKSKGPTANLFRAGDYRQLTEIPKATLVFQIAYSTFNGTGWGAEDQWTPNKANNETIYHSPFLPQWSEAELYWVTGNLNKKAMGQAESDMDGLRAHRWTHITMNWWLGNNGASDWSQTSPHGERLKVMVNGIAGKTGKEQVIGNFGSKFSGNRAYNNANARALDDRQPRFGELDFIDHELMVEYEPTHASDERWHFPGDRWEQVETDSDRKAILNTFRLGEASTHSFMPNTFSRNFSSDGTYDEFYFWKDSIDPYEMGEVGLASGANPNNLAAKKFLQGRYHVPTEDSIWTSPKLVLKGVNQNRELPLGSKNVATGGIKAEKPSGVGMTTTAGDKITVRLLGVSWTWYAEKYNNEISGNTLGGLPSLMPVMVDYQNPSGPSDLRQEKSCARLFVTVDDLRYPLNDPVGMTNDAFSPIQDSAGQAVALGENGVFQYHVMFKVEGSDISTVLLSTPVLDDVTFFYLTPGTPYLQYVEKAEIE